MDNVQSVEEIEDHRLLGTILVIISASAFGFMAIFAKFAYKANLNMLTILSWRFLIAAVVMWSIVGIKKLNPLLERKQVVALLLLGGLGYGLMSSAFFNSVRLIPASIASILLYTYPVIVTVLSAWVYKEKINSFKLFALVISSVGLVMVIGVAFHGLNFWGVFSGCVASVAYSLYIILSNRLLTKVNPIIITAYISTAAALVFNIVGWSTGANTVTISGLGWFAIMGIAIVSSVVAILTFFQGMKLVGPSKTSIISSLEPVITISAAAMLFAETLTLVQVMGAVMIIGAVILIQKA